MHTQRFTFGMKWRWRQRSRPLSAPLAWRFTLVLLLLTASLGNTLSSSPEVQAAPSLKFPWDKASNPWSLTQAPHDWGSSDTNSGLDFAKGKNNPQKVLSMFEGYVSEIGLTPGKAGCSKQNPTLKVRASDGSGWELWYLHMSSYSVKPYQHVKQGTLLGVSGDKGCSDGVHLHVELVVNGVHESWVGKSIDGWTVPNSPQSGLISSNSPPSTGGKTIWRIEVAVRDLSTQTLSSVPTAFNPAHPTIPAEVKFTNLGTNKSLTRTLNLTYRSAEGAYVTELEPGLPEGQYALKIRFRDRVRTLVGTTKATVNAKRYNSFPRVLLIPGDAYNDNKLDIRDYNMIISCYGANYPSCGADAQKGADFTDDGAVNEFDYNLWLRQVQFVGGSASAKRFEAPTQADAGAKSNGSLTDKDDETGKDQEHRSDRRDRDKQQWNGRNHDKQDRNRGG